MPTVNISFTATDTQVDRLAKVRVLQNAERAALGKEPYETTVDMVKDWIVSHVSVTVLNYERRTLPHVQRRFASADTETQDAILALLEGIE